MYTVQYMHHAHTDTDTHTHTYKTNHTGHTGAKETYQWRGLTTAKPSTVFHTRGLTDV